MKETHQAVIDLSDGLRNSAEIAEILGLRPRHVRKIWTKYNCHRPNQGAQRGDKNHQYRFGRSVDLDGYVVTAAPQEHPHRRATGIMYEHRLVMEKKIGRYLLPTEVVDHIDGLTLHNHPDNLRLFENNGEHLSSTISGRKRYWSEEGRRNIGARTDLGRVLQRVDTYNQRKEQGDVRYL